MDTWALQRLRGIKQLALAYLVYPGATHTRFEHSLGTMHLAGKLAERVRHEGLTLDTETVRIAGLLHDIGHGPFSHASERVLAKFSAATASAAKPAEIHEAITLCLLKYDDNIQKILGDTRLEKVTRLLQKSDVRTIERDIISGPMDADKLDYLLRDSYYAGVKYGMFDLERVVDTVKPIQSARESQMGIAEDGVWAVEQLLLAKHHMNMQVYRHKIRSITDAMLSRAIELSIEERVPELDKLYSFEPSKQYLSVFTRYDDYTLLRAIVDGSKGNAREIVVRLQERRLLKKTYERNLAPRDFDALQRHRIATLGSDELRKVEQRVAELMKVEPAFVIVDIQTIDNPTHKPPGIEISKEDILIRREDGRHERFGEYPLSLIGSAKEPQTAFVYVYSDQVDESGKEDLEARITRVFKES